MAGVVAEVADIIPLLVEAVSQEGGAVREEGVGFKGAGKESGLIPDAELTNAAIPLLRLTTRLNSAFC